jgi:GDPmannose 4,6-dehydratase
LAVLQASDPEEVYSLGGQTSVGLSFHYPVETFESISVATLNILECLRLLHHPARFYHASSSECYGNTVQPATEETPFRPRSPYAVAKAAAHHAVANYREAYGLFACNGILFNHESPLRPARFVTQKIVSAALRIAGGSKEKVILGNLKIQRDWGWAPEYVEGMWKILQQDQAEDFVIATGETNSLEEFTSKVFARLNLDWHKHVESNAAFFRPSDLEISRGDPSRARQKLNWSAKIKFEDVIEKLVLDKIG